MRALIFTDIAGPTARALIDATIEESQRRHDLEICGFVTANPDEVLISDRQRFKSMAKALAVRATGGRARIRPALNLARIAQRLEVPLIVAEPDVNDNAFIQRLHHDLRPDLLLSYFFTQILREPLLDSFAQAVNYHDGLLPEYGGLAATSHSVYHGEPVSGFTFHRITTGIDAGPILVQGSVPISGEAPTREVDTAKLSAAVNALTEVFDKISANEPGTVQQGSGSYFSQNDYNSISTIVDPSAIAAHEISRRIRAYGSVTITIGGKAETVTQIKPVRLWAPFGFRVKDDRRFRASRIARLPGRLIWVRRQFRRSSES